MTDIRTLIWWVNQQDCAVVRALGIAAPGDRITASFSENDGMPGWPSYIADAYSSRYGRAGRGRLFTAYGMKKDGINPWPDTALAKALGDTHGGILIWARDLEHVRCLPGIVTDMTLRLVTSQLAVVE